MTYNATIPAAADQPSVSQGQLLTNFGQLEAVFDVDHVPFTTGVGGGGGRHDRVVFNNVAVAPGLATPVASLYTAADGAGVTQLFYENEVAGVNVQSQMTNLTITNLGNPGTALGTLYRIDSPAGYTIYMGQTNAFSGNRTVTFPAAYTTIYSTTCTANDVNVQRVSVGQAVGGLTIYTENAVSVNWTAIGTI